MAGLQSPFRRWICPMAAVTEGAPGSPPPGPQVGRNPRYRKPGRATRRQADSSCRRASDNVDSVGEGRELKPAKRKHKGASLRPERNLRVERSSGLRVVNSVCA